MTNQEIKKCKERYISLIKRKLSLCTSTNKNPQWTEDDFQVAYFSQEKMIWLAFSEIAKKTSKSNRIYVAIRRENIQIDAGVIVTRHIFMNLETLEIIKVPTLELGEFFRNENPRYKTKGKNNIVLDPDYCSGWDQFQLERLRFFKNLLDYSQEVVVARYENGDYLEQSQRRRKH